MGRGKNGWRLGEGGGPVSQPPPPRSSASLLGSDVVGSVPVLVVGEVLPRSRAALRCLVMALISLRDIFLSLFFNLMVFPSPSTISVSLFWSSTFSFITFSIHCASPWQSRRPPCRSHVS